MKIKTKKRISSKGQLSIFVILIFQTLFILFAMSLNVALVVHDKINLQNSIDIATYYGATKQAEMMNAIAHINYQIRQSWKLLSWRYRVLGSMSVTKYAPNTEKEYKPQLSGRPIPYFFCIGHQQWGAFLNGSSTTEDNLCYNINTVISKIKVPVVTGVLGGFAGLLSGIKSTTELINQEVKNKCIFHSQNTWLFGIMSFIHFYRDQAARKFMILKLAELMSQGRDLDGNLISKGVEKTFYKNLSFSNKKSYQSNTNQLKQFNSLQNTPPNKWLIDTPFKVLGLYARSDVTGDESCSTYLDILNNPPQRFTTAHKYLQEIGNHSQWPCQNPHQCAPSAGLQKIENFIVFYSAKVSLSYKNQIFLPFYNKLNLKARAFAKPFGGRIGPPFNTDKLLPKISGISNLNPTIIDNNLAPNYSRFPGDTLGLKSSHVQSIWGNYIRNNAKVNTDIHHYLNKDPVAAGVHPNTYATLSRQWEIVAISPDLFDVTYFTILPYYAQTYYQKIQNILSSYANILRGDLGMYKSKSNVSRGYPLSYQIQSPQSNLLKKVPIFKNLFYKIKKMDMLLTGWNPQSSKYHSGEDNTQNTFFGKCSKWININKSTSIDTTTGLIANGCIYGGRTGYSVKMVSQYFLQGLQESSSNQFPTGDPDWY